MRPYNRRQPRTRQAPPEIARKLTQNPSPVHVPFARGSTDRRTTAALRECGTFERPAVPRLRFSPPW